MTQIPFTFDLTFSGKLVGSIDAIVESDDSIPIPAAVCLVAGVTGDQFIFLPETLSADEYHKTVASAAWAEARSARVMARLAYAFWDDRPAIAERRLAGSHPTHPDLGRARHAV